MCIVVLDGQVLVLLYYNTNTDCLWLSGSLVPNFPVTVIRSDEGSILPTICKFAPDLKAVKSSQDTEFNRQI